MALATYFTRYAMIAALGREAPLLLRRWLRPRLGYVGRGGCRLAHSQRPADHLERDGRFLAAERARSLNSYDRPTTYCVSVIFLSPRG
jgi:hypothetical protein